MKLIVKPLVIVAVLLALTTCHAQDDGKATNQATLDSPFDTVAIIGVENETYLETNKVFKNNDGSRRIQNITIRCAMDRPYSSAVRRDSVYDENNRLSGIFYYRNNSLRDTVMYFGGHRFKTKVPDKRNWIQYEMILCSYFPETGKPTAAIHEKRTRYDDDSFWTTCEYEIYEYDSNNGSLISITCLQNDERNNTAIREKRFFDSLGHLTRTEISDTHYEYKYDPRGNCIMELRNGVLMRRRIFEEDRLAIDSVMNTSNDSRTVCQYNGLGLLTIRTTFYSGQEMTSFSRITYEYDIFGRVIKEHHLSVDESGMPWKDIEQRYEYNDRTGKIIMETVNNLDNDTINPTIFKYCSLKIIECLL